MSSGVRGQSPAYFQLRSQVRSRRARGPERGGGRPRRASRSRRNRVGGGDRVDAGPKAWACEAGGARPGMGSGVDRGGCGRGRGLGGRQAKRPPRVPRAPPAGFSGRPEPTLIPPGRHSGRFGRLRVAQRARGPRLPPPPSRLARLHRDAQPARRRAEPRLRREHTRPPPPSPSAPPRAPPRPQPRGPCVAVGPVNHQRCEPPTGGLASTDPAGGAGCDRRAGPPPSAALGLED
nr:basic salivary proline-rich protein 2-like [Camelus dromedarius]